MSNKITKRMDKLDQDNSICSTVSNSSMHKAHITMIADHILIQVRRYDPAETVRQIERGESHAL